MTKDHPRTFTASNEPPSTLSSPQRIKRARRDSNETEVSDKSLTKIRKRRRAGREGPDLNHDVKVPIGRMDTQLLADYVNLHTKRHQTELSAVELEDLRIPESAFQDTRDWTTSRLIEHLPEFLTRYSSLSKVSKELTSASMKPGTPHTLVVVAAGLRAADVVRALRTFQTKDAAVAKLFAKHIKLEEAINYLKKTRIGIGVGTPGRILDLFNADALCFESLERVVIDCSHVDLKRRSIFDMRETQKPLIQLLNLDELKCRYGDSSNQTNLLIF